MSLDRRLFLKGSLAAGAGFAVTGSPSIAVAQPWYVIPSGLPTVQLYTDETSAQFKVLIDPAVEIEYVVTASDSSKPVIDRAFPVRNPYNAGEAIEHLYVTGLNIKATYTLKMYNRATGAEVDARTFNALDTRKPNGRFALVSCMLDLLLPIQAYMWQAMEDAKVDVIFIIGDTSYTDALGGDVTLEIIWNRHFQSRRAIDLYWFKHLKPVIASWDDHDYGGNNSDRTSPLNGRTKEVFKAMWGWTPHGTSQEGPGVATALELFGQRFFLMDDRTWRDPYEANNGLQWGVDQETWLLTNLMRDARPAWILNGSQFFGAYLNKDSFEQRHPYQFRNLINHLRSVEAPVMFGSGDIHFSEIMRIEKEQLGYETIEITSSSMHSLTTPWINTRHTNPRRVDTTWHYNFVVAQGDATQNGRFKFRTISVGKGLRVYFDRGGTIIRTSKAAIR